MIERFDHNIEADGFEMRFAKCISNPTVYLDSVRLQYLDEHEGDISDLVSDVVDELTVYLEHADSTLPQLDRHPQFKLLEQAREAKDFYLTTKFLFSLLKKSGFLREEVDRYLVHIPDIDGKEEELKLKGERVIFNEIYGNQ